MHISPPTLPHPPSLPHSRYLSPNSQVSPSCRDPSPTAEDTRIEEPLANATNTHQIKNPVTSCGACRRPGTCLCRLLYISLFPLTIPQLPLFLLGFLSSNVYVPAAVRVAHLLHFSKILSFQTPFSFVNVAHTTGSPRVVVGIFVTVLGHAACDNKVWVRSSPWALRRLTFRLLVVQ